LQNVGTGIRADSQFNVGWHLGLLRAVLRQMQVFYWSAELGFIELPGTPWRILCRNHSQNENFMDLESTPHILKEKEADYLLAH
jgi:hypothetical protein